MRKTIVIPTDFTVNSLNTLKAVLSNNTSGTSLDIILLHGMNLSDSIRDLLFFSKMKHIDALSNTEFEEACEVLCNKFDSHINSLKTDLFTGFNQSAFNSYLESNRIEKIYISDSKQNLSNKNSFDLSVFIKKSVVEVITINSDTAIPVPEKGKITEVFLNQVSIS
ncbi:hypothetical protein NAT51_10520 [Flavobacterium amniphilum]|uniref:hypothetical protein n=1 Tax=Flavobacterium amniphilum TaxID=1834035 RepID=UPI00202A3E74|nr:hypothetical protein [Flavobacterium amniphilum]MCL9805959.1 hypothetical protein [Flavobacterium amniphilum]